MRNKIIIGIIIALGIVIGLPSILIYIDKQERNNSKYGIHGTFNPTYYVNEYIESNNCVEFKVEGKIKKICGNYTIFDLK